MKYKTQIIAYARDGNLIAVGQTVTASDFITKGSRNATKALDTGRVPRLESNGFLSLEFLNQFDGTITYNEMGDIATMVDTRSNPDITYTFNYTGEVLTSITDGTNTWTITWSDEKITSIIQTP